MSRIVQPDRWPGLAAIAKEGLAQSRPMSRRPPLPFSSRFALWLFACALLLKAAVPLLASASAEVQGKALVEVCTVYGVKTIALDGEPAPDHPAAHAGDHCPLSAVVALGGPAPEAAAAVVPASAVFAWLPPATAPPVDASARWLAQRHHAPPLIA